MSTAIRMTGARERAAIDCDTFAAELWSLLQELRGFVPAGARWSILSRSYKHLPVYSARDLKSPLAASRPARASEIVRGAPTHRATLRCSLGKAEALHLSVAFSIDADPPPRAGLTVQLALDDTLFATGADARTITAGLFKQLVCGLSLDAARAAAASVPVPGATSNSAVRVGFLTLLPSRLGPLPPLPPDCEAVVAGGLGWILVAHPAFSRLGGVEQESSLAHLRFALGARALRDGPAFPHPSSRPSEPAAGQPPEIDLQGAAADLPSYLRGEAPAAQVAVPVRAPESGPGATATAVLSPALAALAKSGNLAAVPFASAASVAKADLPQSEGPQRQSGLTEDIDVGALARRVLAFGQTPPPGKRLVRFNPQTGEPLAQPYWDDIPSAAPARK